MRKPWVDTTSQSQSQLAPLLLYHLPSAPLVPPVCPVKCMVDSNSLRCLPRPSQLWPTPAFLPGSQDKSCAPAVKLVHSPLPERTLRLPAFRPLLMPFPISATENPTQNAYFLKTHLKCPHLPGFAHSSNLLGASKRVVSLLALWSSKPPLLEHKPLPPPAPATVRE